MMIKKLCVIAGLLFVLLAPSVAQEVPFERGDHVCYIGNTLADRMQHHGWLETYIHALLPDYDLTFRNLGFSGDEIKVRQRADNFGDPDQWLTKCKADVVACFFGYNEALKGPAALTQFTDDLAQMIDAMRSQKYNGTSAPRLIVFSPIAHENLESPHLPEGSKNNKNLAMYTEEMRKVCAIKQVPFVDLFAITKRLYEQQEQPLTMNGIHLLDHGNQLVAQEIIRQFAGDVELPEDQSVAKLREAVLDKNYHWFSRYRVVDEYNVFGGRSKLAWFGQSNADVMMREMEMFDVMTENRDKRIWAIAEGGDTEVRDDNLPKALTVKPNSQAFPYLGAEEAIGLMTVHPEMEVNLFASEEQFPRLINPVQIAVDTDSRLWASVWPSYPHWNPTEPRKDALVILPDENNDGKADDCIIFADELNSVTGFEFWGGGVLVAAPPEIWFLKDTDGDDRADVKIRVLQGVSSADTHHSANAVLIGPDGWMYWSRGIFNVAAFETPTKTYRSGASGVHRFNPRTFEMEFHYPIGPNPHGDVFDRWGFQFANDGTSGTGGYVSLGKGLRPKNRQWFKQQWRPVAATGLLSSSQFPEKFQNNFMICNTIGFLGVLHYEVKYNGAEITAERTDDIVRSSDPNFRPSDIEVGGDGAVYVADWHNSLIGHMQHNMRDPNRDNKHGRIYRIAAKGRAPLTPVKMKGKPIEEVLQNFFARENSTRYRTRLELSGRDTSEVVQSVEKFTAALDPANDDAARDESQALLECLWVHEEHRVPSMPLIKKAYRAKEPRVRAAVIRTMGHWAGKVPGWEDTLLAAAKDESALVRAEAAKAAVEFAEADKSVEAFFEVAFRELDPELNDVLDYAKRQLPIDEVIAESLRSGKPLSPAAEAYALKNLKVEDLVKLPPTERVYREILGRPGASDTFVANALTGLTKLTGANPVTTLLDLMERAEREGGNVGALGQVLAKQPAEALSQAIPRIKRLATQSDSADGKRAGFAAWIAASGPGDAFLAASQSKDSLRDFLDAVPAVSESVRAELYDKVEPLIASLPPQLQAESNAVDISEPGMTVEFFDVAPKDVAMQTLDQLTPVEVGVVSGVSMDVPQRTKNEGFAMRFTGMLRVTKSGRYEFRVESDDGSRVYINGKQIINNDGPHGMVERRGAVVLAAGSHEYVVTYSNITGGRGLMSGWRGPGFDWQKVPVDRLSLKGSESIHDVAIAALASIPGRGESKFRSLAAVVASGRSRPAAIDALAGIHEERWPEKEIRPLADNLIGYLSEMPPRARTSESAATTVSLVKRLATKLSAEVAKEFEERLKNLDVRIIAIGTVPTRMIYDKEMIVAQAGKPVEFRFSNTDAMPHNFAVVRPGTLQEVGELAEATGRDDDAAARNYIPMSDSVLVASKLLQPGQNQAIAFEVPKQPGVYPYVCTYPGHWRRMYGALYVVKDLEAYQADPDGYLAANPLPILDDLLKANSRGQQWQYDDLIASMEPHLPSGRSFEVGKELFKVASCAGCHQLNGEGRVFGPDLAKLSDDKHTVPHILRSILEPSKEIDPEYQSYTFVTDTGDAMTGMIMKEDDANVHIVVDPLAKDATTIIPKEILEERVKTTVSMMPAGLLDRLSREEVLDLIAYVFAKGDAKHALYKEAHEHHHH